MTTLITREPAQDLQGYETTFVAAQSIHLDDAARQHQAYRDTLASCGIEVIALPAQPGLPDSLFVEDVVLALPECVVLTRPGAASRQAEVALFAADLARHGLFDGRPVHVLQAPATLEGGDVLRLGRTLYVGLSSRTNAAGVAQLRDWLAPMGYTVQAVPVMGCLHLKTGVTALDEHTVLAQPDWVDLSAMPGLTVLHAAPGEPWAANVLKIGPRLFMNAASPRTAETLRARGHAVQSIDIGEFMKMEAGLTCMHVLWRD